MMEGPSSPRRAAAPVCGLKETEMAEDTPPGVLKVAELASFTQAAISGRGFSSPLVVSQWINTTSVIAGSAANA